jgi:hypothetical protein
MKPLLALAAAALLTFAAPASAQVQHDVRGVVTDSAGAPLNGAMVVALAMPDSVLTKFALSDGEGRFTLRRLPVGDYLLQVTMVGRQVMRHPFSIAAADVDAGTLRLAVLAVEMEALVVSVDHVPFVTNRDTLDYNALAFSTRPNATVEDLLARLPGIEVASDGSIKAQGEDVKKVLVDGKEFFGADPTIATRNLPAEAIERVQVYDKQSDMAEFTGIADGQEERTINLQLRENARRGYFGQVEGGLGGGLQPESGVVTTNSGRARYTQGLNINRFTPTTQLALLGAMNNVNQAGFAWGDMVSFRGALGGSSGSGTARGGGGFQLGGGRNDGFTETRSIGLNVNRDFGSDRWIRSSYFLSSLDNAQNQTVLQQQLFGSEVAARQDQTGNQVTDNVTHRLDLSAQYTFAEGHDVRLRSNLNVGTSSMTGFQSQETRNLSGVVQNTGTSTSSANSDDFSGSARVTWRKRLAENGRALVAEAWSDLREPETLTRLATTTGTVNRAGELVLVDVTQDQSDVGRTLSFSQRLSLTQPMTKGGTLELFGERRAVDQDQTKTVNDLQSGAPVFNDLLSSAFERTYSYLRGGFRFNKASEETRLVLGLQVQGSNLDGVILDRAQTIENGYTHVLPSADLRLQFGTSRTLNVRYSTSTREPSMTELQPFTDNTNPLRTYVGNPDLTPEYTHSINTDYRFFDQFSFVNLFTYLRFAYTRDNIVTSRSVDEQLIQTVMPVNLGNTWSTNGGVTYGRPIRRIGAQVNLNYGIGYSRGLELLNSQENESRVWRNSFDASIENRDREIFELRAGARLAFNDVAYTLNTDLNQGYVDRTFYGSGELHTGNGWTFSSQLNYQLFDKDVFGTGDRDVAMLEAGISKLAMNDRVEIHLVGFDLLNQNKGVSFSSGSSYIRESRTESLGRYMMLKATYRLGSRPGAPGPGGGGGGMRPGG